MKSMRSYKHKHRLKGNKSKVISPIDALIALFPAGTFDPVFVEDMRKFFNAIIKRVSHE